MKDGWGAPGKAFTDLTYFPNLISPSAKSAFSRKAPVARIFPQGERILPARQAGTRGFT